MNISTEEKKHALCVQGVPVASGRVLYPHIDGKEKISAFYSGMAENLIAFFREKSENYRESFEALPRREKRSFQKLCMNMFFHVTFSEGGILSIVREYVLCEGKAVLAYRKSGEIWGEESELLLPAKKFFPHKMWKTAEKEEFYFDGEAVLVENLFPESTGGDGRRTRLSDYIKETRVKLEQS